MAVVDLFIQVPTLLIESILLILFYVDKYSHKILIGDAFYIYSCPACSRTGESFERLPMSW